MGILKIIIAILDKNSGILSQTVASILYFIKPCKSGRRLPYPSYTMDQEHANTRKRTKAYDATSSFEWRKVLSETK